MSHWSPDGHFIAYESYKSSEDINKLAVYNIQDKDTRYYELELGSEGGIEDIAWFYTGDNLLYAASDSRIFKLDLSTGKSSFITTGSGVCLNPDDSQIATREPPRSQSRNSNSLKLVNLKTGAERTISYPNATEITDIGDLGFSTDGEYAVFTVTTMLSDETADSEVWIADIASGGLNRVATNAYSPAWQSY